MNFIILEIKILKKYLSENIMYIMNIYVHLLNGTFMLLRMPVWVGIKKWWEREDNKKVRLPEFIWTRFNIINHFRSFIIIIIVGVVFYVVGLYKDFILTLYSVNINLQILKILKILYVFMLCADFDNFILQIYLYCYLSCFM